MKKLVGFSLIVAVVLSLGLVPVAAWAQVGTFTNGAGNQNFATEIFGTGSDATLIPTGHTNTVVYTVGTTPNVFTHDFFLDFTLPGAVHWGTTPVQGDLVYTGTGTATISNVVVAAPGGFTTANSVRFRVIVGPTPPVGAETFTFTYHLTNCTAALSTPSAISMSLGVVDDIGQIEIPNPPTLAVVHSINGTTETLSEAGGTTPNIDASGTGSLNFILSPPTVTATLVRLATLAITDNAATEDSGAVAWAAFAGDATATGVLTLHGNFSPSIAAVGSVFLDVDKSNTFTAGDIIPSNIDGATATYNLTNAQLLAIKTAVTIPIVMAVDGATPIENQTPTGALTITWTNPTYQADSTATTNLQQLLRDTVTRRLFNIPGSTDAANDRSFVRITNIGDQPGDVFGRMYAQNGTDLGFFQLNTTGPVAGHETLVLNMAQLEAIFGVWTNRSRLDIDGQFTDMEAMGFIRSADGSLCNMSPMAIH